LFLLLVLVFFISQAQGAFFLKVPRSKTTSLALERTNAWRNAGPALSGGSKAKRVGFQSVTTQRQSRDETRELIPGRPCNWDDEKPCPPTRGGDRNAAVFLERLLRYLGSSRPRGRSSILSTIACAGGKGSRHPHAYLSGGKTDGRGILHFHILLVGGPSG